MLSTWRYIFWSIASGWFVTKTVNTPKCLILVIRSSQYVSLRYRCASSAKRKIGGIFRRSRSSTSFERISSTTILRLRGETPLRETTREPPSVEDERNSSRSNCLSAESVKSPHEARVWYLAKSASLTNSLHLHW